MLNFASQDTSKQLLIGEGWRIGLRSDVDLYKGLVGTDSWAIELTEGEFKDFCKLASQLAETMQIMLLGCDGCTFFNHSDRKSRWIITTVRS